MILKKITEVIVNQLGVEEDIISLETSFTEDLGADSLGLFEIIMELEEVFEIQIEDTEGINTVGDAVKVIEEKIKDK